MAPCPANFFVLAETRFHYLGQDGLKLLTSGVLPASALQIARITGVSHNAQLELSFFFFEMESSSVAKARVQW